MDLDMSASSLYRFFFSLLRLCVDSVLSLLLSSVHLSFALSMETTLFLFSTLAYSSRCVSVYTYISVYASMRTVIRHFSASRPPARPDCLACHWLPRRREREGREEG